MTTLTSLTDKHARVARASFWQRIASQISKANSAQAKARVLLARSKLLYLNVLSEAEGQVLHVSKRFFPLPRFNGLDATITKAGSITAAFATCGLTDCKRQESRITAQIPKVKLPPNCANLLTSRCWK
jgi:GntR family phosphonate transport system transcriptional regulator